MGTEVAPCKMLDSAAGSVVKVLAEAASWLAGGVDMPGALLGEGDIWPDEAALITAGAWLELAGGILDAEPAGMEAEEGAAEEAALEGEPDIGTAFPLAPPGTQPGTSCPEAGAGPSVTATQPGRFGNRLPGSTFS